MWNRVKNIWAVISALLFGVVLILFATGKLELPNDKKTEVKREQKTEQRHNLKDEFYLVHFGEKSYLLHKRLGVLCSAGGKYIATFQDKGSGVIKAVNEPNDMVIWHGVIDFMITTKEACSCSAKDIWNQVKP